MKLNRTQKYKEFRENLKGNFQDNLDFHIKYIINDYLQEHKDGSYAELNEIVMVKLYDKFKGIKND